ncbi:MAG TPA: hypothetical protein VGL24_11525 [Chthoniobacterales bacterium]
MKSLLLLCLFAIGATSCTTLSNRRDLYNPSDDAGPYNAMQQKKTAPGTTVAPEGPPTPQQ